jgi:hypothetical protein
MLTCLGETFQAEFRELLPSLIVLMLNQNFVDSLLIMRPYFRGAANPILLRFTL